MKRSTFSRCLAWAATLVLSVGAVATATAASQVNTHYLLQAKPTSASRLPPGVKPPQVPANYVVTPGGYFDPSCVHMVGPTDRMLSGGRIQASNGAVTAIKPCTQPHYSRTGRMIASGGEPTRTASASGAATKPDIAHAYVEDATWVAPAALSRISANWTVPSNPTQINGQTVFFFPGLEDANNVVTILQPVLGFNGFGDNVWTLASWNCCYMGNELHSAPFQVNPGDQLFGDTYGTCPAGQVCTEFTVVSKDLSTGESTTLPNTSSYGQNFNWAFGAALEVYNISSCRQYPRSGTTHFSNLKVYDVNKNLVAAPPWSGYVDSSQTPTCLYHVDASSPTDIYLSY